MVMSFFRPLLRLQWKLTFSYTLITATTLVLLTLVSIVAGSETAAANFSQLVTSALQSHAFELVPYLSVAPPDRAGIERWLQQPGNLTAQVVLSFALYARAHALVGGNTAGRKRPWQRDTCHGVLFSSRSWRVRERGMRWSTLPF
jgi:hypothetical protein